MRVSALFCAILILTTAAGISNPADPTIQNLDPASLSGADPAPSPAPTSTPSPQSPTNQLYAQGDTIEIAHPYNPKSLGVIPPGWIPKPIPNYSVRNANIKLKNGNSVIIDCPIYALVPDTKSEYIAFGEPGFDPTKGNNQTGTLGNIITQYIADNDELGKQIDELGKQIHATLIQLQNRFTVTERKPDPNEDANRLLIDKPTPPTPTSSPVPDTAPSPTPTAAIAPAQTPAPMPPPAPTPTPAVEKKEKKKEKKPSHPTHINSKAKSEPSPTPTPTRTPAGKFLGLFPVRKDVIPDPIKQD
jgi:hypothetical protein